MLWKKSRFGINTKNDTWYYFFVHYVHIMQSNTYHFSSGYHFASYHSIFSLILNISKSEENTSEAECKLVGLAAMFVMTTEG